MDLSRISAAPIARLGPLALEGQGAFPSQWALLHKSHEGFIL